MPPHGRYLDTQVGIEYQESRVEPAGFEERTGGDRLVVAASASFSSVCSGFFQWSGYSSSSSRLTFLMNMLSKDG